MAVVLPGMPRIFVGGPVSGPDPVTISPPPSLIKLAMDCEGVWFEPPPHDTNTERSAPNEHNSVARVHRPRFVMLVSK
jgi:hypothetical protein